MTTFEYRKHRYEASHFILAEEFLCKLAEMKWRVYYRLDASRFVRPAAVYNPETGTRQNAIRTHMAAMA